MNCILKVLNSGFKKAIVIIMLMSLLVSVTSCGCDNNSSDNENIVTQLKVQSNSMEPEFVIGDKITIYKVKPEDIKVGDIIYFSALIDNEEHFITHRVIEVLNSGKKLQFRTKGDNCEAADDLVDAENVLGIYLPD